MRLSDHLEHESGLTIFQHACRVGLEGIVSSGITLPFWPVPGLDQIQEPECACGNARRGRRLVALMTTLTMRMIKGDFVVTGPDVGPMRFQPRPRLGTGARRTIPARPSLRLVLAANAQLRNRRRRTNGVENKSR